MHLRVASSKSSTVRSRFSLMHNGYVVTNWYRAHVMRFLLMHNGYIVTNRYRAHFVRFSLMHNGNSLLSKITALRMRFSLIHHGYIVKNHYCAYTLLTEFITVISAICPTDLTFT